MQRIFSLLLLICPLMLSATKDALILATLIRDGQAENQVLKVPLSETELKPEEQIRATFKMLDRTHTTQTNYTLTVSLLKILKNKANIKDMSKAKIRDIYSAAIKYSVDEGHKEDLIIEDLIIDDNVDPSFIEGLICVTESNEYTEVIPVNTRHVQSLQYTSNKNDKDNIPTLSLTVLHIPEKATSTVSAKL